jgi:hypothetical protein
MSFRQDKHKRLVWTRWVQKNRDTFVECGLPDDVYENRYNWLYFLDHGGLYSPARPHWFNISKLSRDQQRKLLAFLQQEYAAEKHPFDVVLGLRSALGIAPPIRRDCT